jgi:hypothetical protein
MKVAFLLSATRIITYDEIIVAWPCASRKVVLRRFFATELDHLSGL